MQEEEMLLKMGESSATFHVYLIIAVLKLKMNNPVQWEAREEKEPVCFPAGVFEDQSQRNGSYSGC